MVTSKILILLSGGIDSTACLHYYQTKGNPLQGLFLDYGQPAAERESDAAAKIADHYRVPFAQLKLSGCSRKSPGLITGRNAFLVFAALLERQSGVSSIALGIHSGTPYWDCSSDFVTVIQRLFDAYTDGKVRLRTPLLEWSKGQVVHYCIEQRIPLPLTYSCESGNSKPCGICLSCKDREAAGVT
jgi:7-cyano-7-deazaguanine synthase